MEYVTPRNVTNGRTAGNSVLCGFVQRLYLENRNTADWSLQFAVGRQTCRRSRQAVASGGDVGGGGAPTIVSRSVATPSRAVRWTTASEDRGS
jgi:hypothetical protein